MKMHLFIYGGTVLRAQWFWRPVINVTFVSLDIGLTSIPEWLLLNNVSKAPNCHNVLVLNLITAPHLVFARHWKQQIMPQTEWFDKGIE